MSSADPGRRLPFASTEWGEPGGEWRLATDPGDQRRYLLQTGAGGEWSTTAGVAAAVLHRAVVDTVLDGALTGLRAVHLHREGNGADLDRDPAGLADWNLLAVTLALLARADGPVDGELADAVEQAVLDLRLHPCPDGARVTLQLVLPATGGGLLELGPFTTTVPYAG